MRGLGRLGLWLCVSLVVTFGAAVCGGPQLQATAQHGFARLRLSGRQGNVTLKACDAACIGDDLCRAYTYNTKTKWCFLKGDAGTPAPFAARRPAPSRCRPAADEIAKPAPVRSAVPGAGPDRFRQELCRRPAEFRRAAQGRDLCRSRQGRRRLPPISPGRRGLVPAGARHQPQRSGRSGSSSPMPCWRRPTTRSPAEQPVRPDRRSRAPQATPRSKASSKSEDTTLRASAARRARPCARAPRDVARIDRHLSRQRCAGRRCRDREAARRRCRDSTASASPSNNVDAEGGRPAHLRHLLRSAAGRRHRSLRAMSSSMARANIAVETEDTQLCITGVEHGKRYQVKVRAGLPSADKETLRADVDLNLYVPDRSPFVGFANNAYVLPAGSRRRPADHLGQRQDRRCRRSTGSATARSPTRCAPASSRARSAAIPPRMSPTSTGEKEWRARSISPRAPSQRAGHHRDPDRATCCPRSSPAPTSSPPRSMASPRATMATTSRRNGSSSPISALPPSRATTASTASSAR